jgi:hypothetical protein
MRTRTALNRSVSSKAPSTDRRQLSRLRDLCDEVLASFRLASGQDPISEQDREAARELMGGVAPMGSS